MRPRFGVPFRSHRLWLLGAAGLLVLTGCAKQGADVNGQKVHSL